LKQWARNKSRWVRWRVSRHRAHFTPKLCKLIKRTLAWVVMSIPSTILLLFWLVDYHQVSWRAALGFVGCGFSLTTNTLALVTLYLVVRERI
jgi:hypothetical protein